MSDDENIVEWIQGKAELKPGLAFPPDFLKRKPVVKTKAEIEKVAAEKKIPVVEVKAEKVKPEDLKDVPKIKPEKAKKVKAATDGPVIRVLVDKFPHKEGSKAEIKSGGFKDGMTVAEYKKNDLGMKSGWQTSHLKFCVEKGFVKIEG